MKLARPERRLAPGAFWREVDAEHNRFVAERLPGTAVLDIGCGYGTLTDHLARLGKRVVGVDHDAESVRVARELHPAREFVEGGFAGRFPDASFDHVVLRDVLHHLYEEGDVAAALREIRRVLKPDGTLVIFDPNVHFVLRLCRRLMAHRDAECALEDAIAALERAGFEVRETAFTEAFALAASGGYVGICWVPPIRALHRALIALDRWTSRAVRALGLARRVLWRYRLVAAPRA